MARSAGESDPSRAGTAGVRDPLQQALHFLSNNIHSLSLRMFVLQKSKLSPELRVHVEAAKRLADQSVTLIERIHEQLLATPPNAGPGPAEPAAGDSDEDRAAQEAALLLRALPNLCVR